MNKEAITCIGIIMDGNRRWAKEHNLLTFEGHRRGYDTLTEATLWARDMGVKHLIAYAFSTENWKRSEEEVGYLMKLFRFVIENEGERLKKEGVRIFFVGDRARFPEDIQKGMVTLEDATKDSARITLSIAVSYGGRTEIVAAACALAGEGKEITEERFAEKLWTAPMPDPDLIIRTGGEHRLSNFLPWQSVYSELFFIDTLWPDFSQKEFHAIIQEYQSRERRFGK